MNASDFLLHGWTWNPPVLLAAAAATAGYATVFRSRARWRWFLPALALTLLTLLSPLNALASGVLFSAHMAQHLLLLMIVPALLLASLPRGFAFSFVQRPPGGRRSVGAAHNAPPSASVPWFPVLAWAAGVGSMWFWHVPVFCDAAATSAGVHALQTGSLLAMGTAFWWPILAPSPGHRLTPGPAIVYLFTACLGCTALGIILTLTPAEVCPVFRAPLGPGHTWAFLRERLSAERDREMGGLLMWTPMCLVYLGAILVELARWLAPPVRPQPERP